MKRIFLFACFLIPSFASLAWGPTGHRTVAQIAHDHLSENALKMVRQILGKETMVTASTWMDEIKSDSKYKDHNPWHYVSIPDGLTYEDIEPSSKGDVIQQIKKSTAALKNSETSMKDKRYHLAMLIHLVGDIHQPLHVGRVNDRGGNNILVTWFGEPSNLHKVWDSEMIDSYQMTYSELAKNLNRTTDAQVEKWQKASVLDWANESIGYRESIYSLGNHKLGYEYSYKHFDTVKLRLLQGGVRLAGLLNEAFE